MPLGHGHQVGDNAECLRTKGLARAAKAGDHFIKDQQDAMGIAQGAQLFQISLGRQIHPASPRDRLDDHRRDGAWVMEGDQFGQLLRHRFTTLFGAGLWKKH